MAQILKIAKEDKFGDVLKKYVINHADDRTYETSRLYLIF